MQTHENHRTWWLSCLERRKRCTAVELGTCPGSGNLWSFVPMSAARGQWKGTEGREEKLESGTRHLGPWWVPKEVHTSRGRPYSIALCSAMLYRCCLFFLFFFFFLFHKWQVRPFASRKTPTRFAAAVWRGTRSISEVCLHSSFFSSWALVVSLVLCWFWSVSFHAAQPAVSLLFFVCSYLLNTHDTFPLETSAAYSGECTEAYKVIESQKQRNATRLPSMSP